MFTSTHLWSAILNEIFVLMDQGEVMYETLFWHHLRNSTNSEYHQQWNWYKMSNISHAHGTIAGSHKSLFNWLWCHQQNNNRSNETHRQSMKIIFGIITDGLIMPSKKWNYVFSWGLLQSSFANNTNIILQWTQKKSVMEASTSLNTLRIYQMCERGRGIYQKNKIHNATSWCYETKFFRCMQTILYSIIHH